MAGLLGVKEEPAVWRWCREGAAPPCLKVGERWRVRREAPEGFLGEKERSATLAGRPGSFLRVPDNVLVVAQHLDSLRRMDAAFFRVGGARDGLLVRFHGGEGSPPEEPIAESQNNGLAAGRLRREGRLLMRPEVGPLGGREGRLGRLVTEGLGGGRAVWASFDRVGPLDLQTALGQQERLAGLVGSRQPVVKTAALEGAIEGWSSAALRRARSAPSGTIFASEDTLSMSRAPPMPPA